MVTRSQLPTVMWLAAAGQILFMAVAWLLPAVSEFDLRSDQISELVLGRLGYLQTAAFVVVGLSVLAFACGLRQATRGRKGSAVGPALVAVYGVTAIVAATFPTDEVAADFNAATDAQNLSATGLVHLVAALIGFLCVVAGMFVSTVAAWRTVSLRWTAPWLMLFPAGALALLFAQAPGPHVGLMQRLLVTVIGTWVIILAAGIGARAGHGEN